jgi:hypothetical protein
VGIATLVAATTPAPAITGGTEDLGNIYKNVGMLVFTAPSRTSARSSSPSIR